MIASFDLGHASNSSSTWTVPLLSKKHQKSLQKNEKKTPYSHHHDLDPLRRTLIKLRGNQYILYLPELLPA